MAREFKLHVSLENVISKRILEKEGWRDMTDKEQEDYLEEIKAALLETCRSQKSEIARSIMRMSPSNLPENIGIYRRVSKETKLKMSKAKKENCYREKNNAFDSKIYSFKHKTTNEIFKKNE